MSFFLSRVFAYFVPFVVFFLSRMSVFLSRFRFFCPGAFFFCPRCRSCVFSFGCFRLLGILGDLELLAVQFVSCHLRNFSPVHVLGLCSMSVCVSVSQQVSPRFECKLSLTLNFSSSGMINSCSCCTCFSLLHTQRGSQPSDALSLIHFRRHKCSCDVLTRLVH